MRERLQAREESARRADARGEKAGGQNGGGVEKRLPKWVRLNLEFAGAGIRGGPLFSTKERKEKGSKKRYAKNCWIPRPSARSSG